MKTMDDTKPLLTPRQAYLCMFEFLRQYYARGQSDEIGGLLGSLSVLTDGLPADPAQASDWANAVRAVMAAESTPAGYREADFRLGDITAQ
jgi:hypothetical protein